MWWVAWASAAEFAGVVVDPDGQPVASAYVLAYNLQGSSISTLTDGEGGYRIPNVPAGGYRLRVVPPNASRWAESWYPEGFIPCNAEVVQADDEVVIDWTLIEGGAFSGRMVDEQGNGRANVQVIARSLSGATLQPRFDSTDQDGFFTILGLPLVALSPEYVLEARAEGLPSQYLGLTYDLASATVFDVGADVGEHSLLPGVSLAGRVAGPSEGRVYAYSGSRLEAVETIDGEYSMAGLPPGDVLVWAEADGFAQTYWPDQDRPVDRISMPEEGMHADDIALALPGEGILRGVVPSREIGSVEGLTALAYNDNRSVAQSGTTDAQGRFEIRGLSEGGWSIYAYAAAAGWTSNWVQAPITQEPQVFSVVSGAVNDVGTLDLVEGGRILGQARDAETGEPLAGVWVEAQGVLLGSLQIAPTNSNGEYSLWGLAQDRHLLTASHDPLCENDPSWVSLYYEDMVNPLWAGGVIVTGGEQVEWNPVLPSDDDHDAMADAWEQTFGLNVGANDADEDPDEDGASNLEEYYLGTDPQRPPVEARCGCYTTGVWG